MHFPHLHFDWLQGRIQDSFKEGVDTSRGARGRAPFGKILISNALKRYFLHFGVTPKINMVVMAVAEP